MMSNAFWQIITKVSYNYKIFLLGGLQKSTEQIDMATEITRLLMQRPKAIFLNAARLDYDKALCFSRLQNLTDLTLNDVDCIKSSDDIVELVNSSKAEIVIAKEMEVL